MTSDASPRSLLSAAAVRRAAQRMLTLAEHGEVAEWQLDLERLPATADFVTHVIRERYPTLAIPLHSRWRHFVFGGEDLGRKLFLSHSWPDVASRARAAFDLIIASVLLDAGAGPSWRYHDPITQLTATRSEGLALASLRWFANGGLSSRPNDPLRVDADALKRIDAGALEHAFQASATHPLLGTDGRAGLLNRLGSALTARPELFAMVDTPRPGGLFDVLHARATNGALDAAVILECLLDALGSIWQNRPVLDGVTLGDCWPHPALQGPSSVDRLAPLHKLSQWLTYSLVEPLAEAGITVNHLDGLTGLAEYRNGGLFIDMGVLRPRDATCWSQLHAVDAPLIVGWRSLTVALLDRLAPMVRERLQISSAALPLGKLLEGGTWAAGRRIARERRADGGPPFQISSDGTVF